MQQVDRKTTNERCNFCSYERGLKSSGLNGNWNHDLCDCTGHCSTIEAIKPSRRWTDQGIKHDGEYERCHRKDCLIQTRIKLEPNPINESQIALRHILSYSLLAQSHNTPLLPPQKFCIIIVCRFSWDMKMS